MTTYYGNWKGMQGKAYILWKTDNGYEVEMVWGGNGVIFRADTVKECKRFLTSKCGAKRSTHITHN